MFERLCPAAGAAITVYVNGRPVAARTGDTVAAALLAAGFLAIRTNAADGALRGPYCLMGVCHDCRVAVDGKPDRQACAIPVADGMRIDVAETEGNG